MSISDEYGLVVFVDAMPSEQLSKQPEEILCLTGVFVDDPAVLAGLRQYKAQRAERRLRMAAELSDAVSRGRPGILACGAVARMDCVARYGDRVLGTLSDVAIDGDDYVFGESRLHRTIALAAGWYVGALATIAACAAGWARDLKQRKVALFVDQFPGVSQTTMELLTRAIARGEVRDQWQELSPRLVEDGIEEIYADTLTSFTEDGQSRSGKDHPHAIIADWLSHALYADRNPAELLDGGAGRTEEDRAAIAEPWTALEGRGAALVGAPDEWLKPATG